MEKITSATGNLFAHGRIISFQALSIRGEAKLDHNRLAGMGLVFVDG